MKEKGGLTFHELKAMKIEERKALAYKILEKQKDSGLKKHLDREWGCFEDLPVLSITEAEEEAERICARMSLEQKINQMTPNTTIDEYIPACLKYNDTPYFAGEDFDLEIPGTKFSDGPTGVVMGRSSTCFPVSMARGATWDPSLEEEIGEAMGIEARVLGANLFGGVCVNLLRHPSWGRSQETYGEDPHLIAEMGRALVRGVQRHVMACVKHFALNSIENARYTVDVQIDERSLREIYLSHFKACVDEGAASVMAAYNKVNGEYCGENRYLLTTILKEEWGFPGFVISDFVNGIRDGKKAAIAGMDIEMPIPGYYGVNLLDLVRRGEVEESVIEEAVKRILSTKIRFSKVGMHGMYTKDKLACSRHAALARQAAAKSAVLLKNEGTLLPLSLERLRKIAVIGRLAARPNIGDMKGSSHVYPPYVVTPLDGIREKAGSGIEVLYSEGVNPEDYRLIVKEADAVIVVAGLTSDDEGEYIPHWNSGCGGDRDNLGLKHHDIEMIQSVATMNRNTIVVMQGGGAIMTEPWDSSVRAILMSWYPGMEGGHALADILFGIENPSGKLPITIPKSYDQLPFFDKDAEKITYDYFHGYFLADKERYAVAYPFGHGLSYTTYAYSNLSVFPVTASEDDAIVVSVDVENTGFRQGEEVVQIYVGYQDSKVVRHVKDLRGFGRVALAPGEKKTFTARLQVKDFAYYDTDSHSWVVEKIPYVIYAGPSSRQSDLLSTIVKIE